MKDYYLILGIKPNSRQDEIKKAYHKMSLEYHPDKNHGDRYFEERFKDILEAYGILYDIEKRKNYDYQRLKLNNERMPDSENLSVNKNGAHENDRKFRVDKTTIDNDTPWAIIIGVIVLVTIFIIWLQNYNNSNSSDNVATYSPQPSTSTNLTSTNIDSAFYNKFIIERKSKSRKGKPKIRDKSRSINGKYLGFNSFFKYSDEVNLLNLKWENYDMRGEKELEILSIKNKTDKTISNVRISFEIFDSSDVQINSGEFNAMLVVGFKGDQTNMDKVESGQTKQFQVTSLDTPHKNASETIIFRVTGVEFVSN